MLSVEAEKGFIPGKWLWLMRSQRAKTVHMAFNTDSILFIPLGWPIPPLLWSQQISHIQLARHILGSEH